MKRYPILICPETYISSFYLYITDHFKSAGVTVFNNNWGNIHDFTQDPDEQHFSNLPEVGFQSYGISCVLFLVVIFFR